MLTTRQYRTIFRELATKHGVDTLGTWTDDPAGRGGTYPDEPRRTVTHEIDWDTVSTTAFKTFVRELRKDPRVFISNDIRLTSQYIKATCIIHEDIWHGKSV